MKILDIQILRGPNFWSINHKLISARLDIGKYEDLPTDKLPGFTERLTKILPGLNDHNCSRGRPGGFIERLHDGTWMGHVTEHIAIEIQTMAGMECTFGKTTGTGNRGVNNVVFNYVEERAGIYAIHAAIRIAISAAENTYYNVFADIENLRNIYLQYSPGPSTSSIIDAAKKRNIPHLRPDEGSLVQLGYGSALKRIEATLTDYSGSIAVDIASDKLKTKNFLRNAAIPNVCQQHNIRVSCTGDGEYFIRSVAAYDIYALIEYSGLNLKEACEKVILGKLTKMGGVTAEP